MTEFTINAIEGLKYLKEKYKTEFVTSGVIVTHFSLIRWFRHQLVNPSIMHYSHMIEKQRTTK